MVLSNNCVETYPEMNRQRNVRLPLSILVWRSPEEVWVGWIVCSHVQQHNIASSTRANLADGMFPLLILQGSKMHFPSDDVLSNTAQTYHTLTEPTNPLTAPPYDQSNRSNSTSTHTPKPNVNFNNHHHPLHLRHLHHDHQSHLRF
jgi:hypothetical protein